MKPLLTVLLLTPFFLLTPTFTHANFDTNLARGASSEEVREVQTFLKAQGYFDEEVTGYFRGVTQDAVIAFQQAHGITPASGFWGPMTRVVANDVYSRSVADTSARSTELTGATLRASLLETLERTLADLRRQLSEVGNTSFPAQVVTDTVVPTVPTNVSLIPTSGTKVYLSWNSSTDDVGVKGYNYYKYENGANIQLGFTSDTFVSVSAVPGTPITLKLKALDTSNNRSEYSSEVTATIPVIDSSQTPVVTFSANQSNVTPGQSATLSWNATNVYACNATEGPSSWRGYKLTSGTFSTGPLSSNTTYTLVCTKDTGTYTRTVTINVGSASDTTAPTAPGQPTATNITQTGVSLAWTASTDAVGVTGYRVYRNGTQIGTPTSNSYAVTGLSAGTTYSFTIAGVDATGNISNQSTSRSVTTLAIPTAPVASVVVSDTTAPTAPGQPTATNITQTGVSLSWSASTDAVGVTGYRVYRNGTQIATPTTNSYAVTGLTGDTTYSFTTAGVDAAGNVSTLSIARSVTTSPVPAPITQTPVTPTTAIASSLAESELGKVARNLGRGEYAKLPNNSSLNNLPIGYSLLYWSDSGVWDPVKKEIAWSGGPGTCCANPATYQRVAYNVLGDTWEVNAMPWSKQGHAYDGNALNPRTGTHYFALAGSGVKSYNGSSWSDLPALSQYSSTVQSLAWFPDINSGNGGLFYFNNDWGSLNWWNGQTWQAVPGANPLAGITGGSFMEYNPVHKVMWVGGKNVSYKIDKNFVVTRLQDSPVSLASGNAFVSVDPVSGKYIVTTASRTWWEYDILNDVWTQINSLTNSPITKSTTSHFHVPIPELGVIVYFSHYYNTREVWVYKHDGSVATAPTATTPTVPVVDPTVLSSVLGTLEHDGPATPEQISLILPVTGTLPQTATAAVRYKQSNSSTWITGHPLYRIRPDYSLRPNKGSVPDAFAWPIIDVNPGTTYDIEVTVKNGDATAVQTLRHTTRALPGRADAPNKIVPAGSSNAAIRTIINGLNPGDVLEFENGTYAGNLIINRSGTTDRPIYIRGKSRDGVVLSATNGSVLQFQSASNIIIENLTLKGSGVDSHNSASSRGIEFWSGASMQKRVTVRNVTMTGVDVGIKAYREISEFLAYDNTLVGNNTWTPSMIDTNATWNDDGINIAGFGNSAFNNTLKGFGDSLALDPQQWATDSVGIHFYRNEIISGGDDGFEADGAHRNISFYDNRLTNTMTLLSLDALFGGPLVAARNISINTGRGPFKFNNKNSGQFIYNNTIIRTTDRNGWGWIQYNNGAQNAWGYRNNILIHQGTGRLFGIESAGQEVIDFTNNSWYPNAGVWWSNSGGSYTNLADAYTRLPARTPLFSGTTKRHEQDTITTINPWTTSITLGNDYKTEITAKYVPTLASGSAPKNSGAVIPNITNGYSGSAPDRGAIISGRSLPLWGDRTGVAVPPVSTVTTPTATTPIPTTPVPTTPTVGTDTTPPTTPGQPTASNITQAEVTLSWNTSTDTVGVTGYTVYKDGVEVDTSVANTITVTGLTKDVPYSFTVTARDAAGNISPVSQARVVTISSSLDTTPPSAPSNVVARMQDARSVRIQWKNPTSVDFAGIRIVRKTSGSPENERDGSIVYSGKRTSMVDDGLRQGTTYYYALYAYDAVKNYAQPVRLTVTVSSRGTTTPVIEVSVPTASSRMSLAELPQKNISMGNKNSDVRQLQKFLNEQSFYVATTGPGSLGKETTNFNRATKNALIRFQEAYMSEILTPRNLSRGTGVLDTATRAVMKRIVQGSTTPVTVPATTPVSTSTIGVTPVVYTFTRTLSLGMSGEDVRSLQRLLNAKGFTIASTGDGAPGNETTYFGLKTMSAVIRFQEAHMQEILVPLDLTRGTGIFGPASRVVLVR